MYFIHTEQFGFELVVLPSKEDAQHDIAQLRQHNAYAHAVFSIHYIDEHNLIASSEDVT